MSLVIARNGTATWRGEICGIVYRKSRTSIQNVIGWEFVPQQHTMAQSFGRREFKRRRELANEITRAFVKMERMLTL